MRLGEQLYRVNSIFTLDGKPASLPVAIGLTTHDEKAQVFSDSETGRISTWEFINDKGVGTGVLVVPGSNFEISHLPSEEKDASHIWLLTSTDENGELGFGAGFAWQGGYGAFSLGQSQLDAVIQYIERQKEHHAEKTFKEEFVEFLRKYKVDYDERYVWS